MRIVERRALAKKKGTKRNSVSSFTIRKPLFAVERSHNFFPRVHFFQWSLDSTHSNSSSEVQCFSCAKRDIWERTVEGLPKSKEALRVKSECVVFSIEKPSECCSNMSSKISVKSDYESRKIIGIKLVLIEL